MENTAVSPPENHASLAKGKTTKRVQQQLTRQQTLFQHQVRSFHHQPGGPSAQRFSSLLPEGVTNRPVHWESGTWKMNKIKRGEGNTIQNERTV